MKTPAYLNEGEYEPMMGTTLQSDGQAGGNSIDFL